MKLKMGDVELHFQISGDLNDQSRPWLVLSHSLLCAADMWWPQLEALSRRYRVLAFDTRGHGASTATPGPYTFDLLADDLRGLLTARGIRRAHFLGLSLGGMIGQTYALKYPDTFTSLILADTTSRWPESAVGAFAERVQIAQSQGIEPLVAPTLGRWFTPAFHQSNPRDVARVAAMIRSTPVTGFAGCATAVPLINTTSRLGEIKCPILIVVGRDDPGTPLAMSREIHDNAPGSTLVVLDHAFHLSNVEQPQAFNQAVLDFLARVDAGGAAAQQ